MSNIISQPLSFDNNNIRFAIQDGITYYSVIDVIKAITNSPIPRNYWSDLKSRNEDFQLHAKCVRFKLEAEDGKFRDTDCASREKIFEIITHIPHKKTSKFREWLARAGEEKITSQEKSYGQKWIEAREEGKTVRKTLTRSLIEHGVEGKQIGDSTNTLYRYAFNQTASSYREYKGVEGENLRDHMTDLELQITSTMEMTLDKLMDVNNSYGYNMVRHDAIDAGEFGGKMRRELERLLGRPVVSKENNLSPKKKLSTKKDKQLVIE